MNSTEIKKRLSDLRKYMKANKLDAFIIPSTDPHLSEYPASHWESRVWISGFTGSAGTVVVTQEEAGLWTDSRYFLQGEQQLEGTTIKLFKEGILGVPSYLEWLNTQLKDGDIVGIDGAVNSAASAESIISKLRKENIDVDSSKDPFVEIWVDRPQIPTNKIFVMPDEIAGETPASKIDRVREYLKAQKANSIIATSLDAVAWLFNIRGNDVKCNPVSVGFAYISDKEAVLFIDIIKLTNDTKEYLHQNGITIADYHKFYSFLENLHECIILDRTKVTLKTIDSLHKCSIVDKSPLIIDLMKAIKNSTELKGFRNAMLKDGVAMVQFLIWLENKIKNNEPLEEIDIPKKLIELREKQNLFVSESFDTIAGYEGNGAIVHYHVTPESSKKIRPVGFLLVDSGAQYFDGTTDLTRTVVLGDLTKQMKEDYTLVLKGHINIALAIYPEGTRGSQIDILARKALWSRGLNYLHGTGHGVGHFLNVHEGPQNIRLNENSTTLEIGMVTSNEPGLYRSNEYGIRIENLVVTQYKMETEYGKFFNFETLTLCPIDTVAIEKDLLTQEEVAWFNDYHKNVFDKLSPLLSTEEVAWLKSKTKAI